MSRFVSAVSLTFAIMAWLVTVVALCGAFYAAATTQQGDLLNGITGMFCLMVAGGTAVTGFSTRQLFEHPQVRPRLVNGTTAIGLQPSGTEPQGTAVPGIGQRGRVRPARGHRGQRRPGNMTL